MLTARTDSLRKRFFLYVVPLFSITPLAVAGQNTTKPGSWSGVLVSSSCNADEAFAESPECTKGTNGTVLLFFRSADW
ncbi:MAG: hypothetical protein DMG54_14560 [Acidobacteria bacterium]|nr:MAG: hypothetical protein DMG54_14560 [Acidobacteriota bacterium]